MNLTNYQVFNFSQFVVSRLRGYPLHCSGDHPGYSARVGCTPAEVFQCGNCGRYMPYCKGCADDLEDLCDHCWCIQTEDVAIARAKANLEKFKRGQS